jgi:hypothetical protein
VQGWTNEFGEDVSDVLDLFDAFSLGAIHQELVQTRGRGTFHQSYFSNLLRDDIWTELWGGLGSMPTTFKYATAVELSRILSLRKSTSRIQLQALVGDPPELLAAKSLAAPLTQTSNLWSKHGLSVFLHAEALCRQISGQTTISTRQETELLALYVGAVRNAFDHATLDQSKRSDTRLSKVYKRIFLTPMISQTQGRALLSILKRTGFNSSKFSWLKFLPKPGYAFHTKFLLSSCLFFLSSTRNFESSGLLCSQPFRTYFAER